MSARRLALILLALAPLMFAAAFAAVPFYSLLCEALGINTLSTLGGRQLVDGTTMPAIAKRFVTVQFDATRHAGFHGEFAPVARSLRARVGERVLAEYRVRNLAAHSLVTQSIPGVAPWQASAHVHKMECFCFQRQPLAAWEERTLAVSFVVAPELPAGIDTITLSYTIMVADGEPPVGGHVDAGQQRDVGLRVARSL